MLPQFQIQVSNDPHREMLESLGFEWKAGEDIHDCGYELKLENGFIWANTIEEGIDTEWEFSKSPLYFAYDKGHFSLGKTRTFEIAVRMVTDSLCAEINGANAEDLTLWTAWNEAVSAGSQVYEDPNGKQYLVLHGDYVMWADNDEYGTDVGLMTKDDLREQTRISKELMNLRPAKSPFKLE